MTTGQKSINASYGQVVDSRASLLRIAIGDLIRSHRKQSKHPMTQEELAHKSGISYEHLNHIENYKSTASVDVLDRIATALGFSRLSEFLACDEKNIL